MSDTKISELVDSLLSGMHGISRSETIVGEAQKAGEATVIPVHRLRVAFGAGSASAGAHGEKVTGDTGLHGAGGAVELDPVAAIAVGKDGHAHLLTVEADPSTTWSALMEKVPDMLTRVAGTLTDRVGDELEMRLSKRDDGPLASDAEAKQIGAKKDG